MWFQGNVLSVDGLDSSGAELGGPPDRLSRKGLSLQWLGDGF